MIPGPALPDVRAAFERCQHRYPTVQLTFEAFLARVSEIVGGEQTESGRRQAFSRLNHEELFLALACSLGDGIAWEHFVDDYLPLVRRFAERACRASAEAEDLAQDLVAALIPPAAPGKPSRLAGYNGGGSLGAWLRVTVARAAIDRFRRDRRQISLEVMEEQGSELPAPSADSARERAGEPLDAHWGPVLSKLLEEELRLLPARDRLILALYYLRGVRLEAIGRQFGVHEATASRWIEAARKRVRKRVEAALRRRHGLRARDLQSLWRQVSDKDLRALEKALAE